MITLLLLLACGGVPEPGVLYDGERLAVVDMHLHPGEWEEIPPSTQSFLASNFPAPFSLIPDALAASVLTGDGILAQLDEAGVSQGVLFAVYAPRTVGIASNELVLEELEADPARLWGLASLRVDQWATDEADELARLAEALEQPGMIGVKLAHAHQHFRLDDERLYSIYELAAAYGAPVYLHTGSSPFPGTAQEAPYTDPAYLAEAVAAHPDTAFVLGHLGYDFVNKEPGALQSCLDLAAASPNVFLEPSALGSASADPEQRNLAAAYAAIREAGLVDRVIYGSDGPQRPGFVAEYLERSVLAMEQSGYSAEEARAVLSGNFARVYGVAEVEL